MKDKNKKVKHKFRNEEDSDDIVFSLDKKRNNLKSISEEIQYEHPDIPQISELIWNFILTPVVMYSGLGRMVIVSERKKTFLFISHAQEIFMHTLPLTYLIIENSLSD